MSSIKREDNDRYETFFQHIIAHLEDNLLTIASGIIHDGAPVEEDEEMSPTVEKIAVYLWLTLIDEHLPAYVARVYAHELQTKSLKDIQPQPAESMDSLLTDLAVQEEVTISYSSTSRQQHREKFKRSTQIQNSSSKSCVLCKTAGRNYQGHDVSSCWFISKFDKLQIAKALSVEVDDEYPEDLSDNTIDAKQVSAQDIQKVQCDVSPYFYAFYKHYPTHIVLDTGVTSSLISRSFVKSVGIPLKPTKHSAHSVDKSSLVIHGEVHVNLKFSNVSLPITALAVHSLDCDILAGVPFCKDNDIHVHLKDELISVGNTQVPYGCKPKVCHDIYRTESFILCNDTAKVILPGEFIEFSSESLKQFDGEVAIEPHISSPMQGTWPMPEISQVIHGTVHTVNNTDNPIPLSGSQHFAQIRHVILPEIINRSKYQSLSQCETIQSQNLFSKSNQTSEFSSCIVLNPHGQLITTESDHFRNLNKQYDSVFDPKFGAYMTIVVQSVPK